MIEMTRSSESPNSLYNWYPHAFVVLGKYRTQHIQEMKFEREKAYGVPRSKIT